MLDAFIIEEIKRREREERLGDEARPVIQLPIPIPEGPYLPAGEREESEPQRGVIVIDL
ncbi:hypothetical protein [Vulgatibacter incomptus]|uniref:Uncharacterized protein n=1 Tax=Vulgatibacter incomptus TaxID=1391653 RepID=A0A0K1PAK1_9BACT|nr:hypothetical protein [Vulgatibacter incomptus]AKU90545.1 hypothetical protein AKJ08_0932 [Vulgatibacter incomptus]